jgi:serine protease Do
MKPGLLSQFVVALIAAFMIFLGYSYIGGAKKNVVIEHVDKSPVQKTLFTLDEAGNPTPLDFTGAAEKSVSAVVHIVAVSGASAAQSGEIMEDIFGRRFRSYSQPQVGTGSGVIINNEGYIVTNNHVINGAEDLEVTLNDKRKFKAKLVGTDPQTDIAVIKISAENLHTLKFSNSDQVKVGQWVLAIGNPFNLTSTVTAGIVSAKGRDIALMDRTTGGIEAFIQTDAAINPGNSGGALVDLNANLIGINTAIASKTGSYAGYGFAVPSNIASRVVSDLIQYGSSQRGFLGVSVASLESPLAKEQKISLTEGALISGYSAENSAAKKAGIQPNDVVVAINDQKVTSSADLIAIVASHRIGDEIKIKVNRKGEEKLFTVKLQNQNGSLATAKPLSPRQEFEAKLGADLVPLPKDLANQKGLEGGVVVKNLRPGILAQHEIEEGFIITEIDNQSVNSPDQVIEALRKNNEGLWLKGYYPNSNQKHRYGISPQ